MLWRPLKYIERLTLSIDHAESETESLEQQVVGFLGSKGISVDRSDIEACHTLPTRTKGANPVIIIRFTNRKNKISILKQGRKLKGTEVYINEHLTRRNGEIARRARILRKQSKIQSTWTASCKVFIKLNGTTTTEDGKVMVINDIGDLDRFDVWGRLLIMTYSGHITPVPITQMIAD